MKKVNEDPDKFQSAREVLALIIFAMLALLTLSVLVLVNITNAQGHYIGK